MQLGSGRTALVTLLHEGGHAAHMANIDQPSPFFGQERAPFRLGTWAQAMGAKLHTEGKQKLTNAWSDISP